MFLTIYLEIMKLGMQRPGDLRGRATEGDPISTASGMVDLESLGNEPAGNSGLVAEAKPKTVSIFLRREPLSEISRRRILLIQQQLIQIGLLFGRGTEHRQHVVHGHGGLYCALIELR